jgi:hypothetical protein
MLLNELPTLTLLLLSVADPGCFIPDPGSGSDHCSILDPDPGGKKARIPDQTYFCIKAIIKFCLLIPDPGSDHCSIPDPDPGGKKAPDPGSATLLLLSSYRYGIILKGHVKYSVVDL